MARQELKQRELLIYSEIGGVQLFIAQLCGGLSFLGTEMSTSLGLGIRKTRKGSLHTRKESPLAPHSYPLRESIKR